MKKEYIIIVLLFLLLIIYLLTKKESYYKHIELSNNNVVLNHTNYNYMDTVVSIGLDQLDIKGVNVIIKPLNIDIKKSFGNDTSLDLKAFIIGNKNQFIIYADNLDKNSCINVLSHELIHLEQYHTGKLIMLTQELGVWNNDTLYVSSIPYIERPWEVEAFKRENGLERQIKNILY